MDEGPDVPLATEVLMDVDVSTPVVTRLELEQANAKSHRLLKEAIVEKDNLETKINEMPTWEQFEELRVRNETMELDFSDKVRSLEDELEQVRSQAKVELDELQSEIDADQSHHARLQAELTTELEEIKRKLKKKSRELTRVKQINDNLRDDLKSKVNSEQNQASEKVVNKEHQHLADHLAELEEETNRLRMKAAESVKLCEDSKEAMERIKSLEKKLHEQETKHITELNDLAVNHRVELAEKDKRIGLFQESKLEQSLNSAFSQFQEKEQRLYRVIKERDEQLFKLRQEMLNQGEDMGKLLEKERNVSKDILERWNEYRKENETHFSKDPSFSPNGLRRNYPLDIKNTRPASKSMTTNTTRPPPPDIRAPQRTKIQDIGKNLWSMFAVPEARQYIYVGELPNGPRHRIMQLMVRQMELEQIVLTAERNLILVNERANAKTRQLELAATMAQGDQEREILRFKTQLQLQERATSVQEAAVQKALAEQRSLREMLLTVESEVEILKRKLKGAQITDDSTSFTVKQLIGENAKLKENLTLSKEDFKAKEINMLKSHAEVERLQAELAEVQNNYRILQGQQVQKNLEAEKNEIVSNRKRDRNKTLEKEVRNLRAKNKDLKTKLHKLKQVILPRHVNPGKKENNRSAAAAVEEEHSDVEKPVAPTPSINVIEVWTEAERPRPESDEFVLTEQTRSRRAEHMNIIAPMKEMSTVTISRGSRVDSEEFSPEDGLEEMRSRCRAVSYEQGTAL